MKKSLVSAVILGSLVLAAAPALADREDRDKPSPKPVQSLRDELRDRQQEFKDELASRSAAFKADIASRSAAFKAEVKQRLSDIRKAHIRAWWSRVQKRLDAVVGRLNATADRIQHRIDALKSGGRDVAQLQKDMNAAKAKIGIAASAIASGSATVDGIIKNNTPTDAFRKLHDLQKSILSALRDAHQALVSVLAETRGYSVTPTPSPTPTASPTPTPTPTP